MLARLRSWWQKASKPLVAVVVTVIVVLLVLLVLIILGYIFNWPWVGLRGVTLYNWLQLLIIPAVLAVGGYLFNYTTSRNEQNIALDNQHEAALQAYIDNMSALLLEKDLSNQVELDKVRKIARVRTLTVLPRCDGRRKALVLQFLCEAGLIDKDHDKKIVDLEGADLSEADLFRAQLSKADLSRANLSRANLIEANLMEATLSSTVLIGANLNSAWLMKADLRGADLREAILDGAKVTNEQLDEAKSLKGATMPDGTIHA